MNEVLPLAFRFNTFNSSKFQLRLAIIIIAPSLYIFNNLFRDTPFPSWSALPLFRCQTTWSQSLMPKLSLKLKAGLWHPWNGMEWKVIVKRLPKFILDRKKWKCPALQHLYPFLSYFIQHTQLNLPPHHLGRKYSLHVYCIHPCSKFPWTIMSFSSL